MKNGRQVSDCGSTGCFTNLSTDTNDNGHRKRWILFGVWKNKEGLDGQVKEVSVVGREKHLRASRHFPEIVTEGMCILALFDR